MLKRPLSYTPTSTNTNFEGTKRIPILTSIFSAFSGRSSINSPSLPPPSLSVNGEHSIDQQNSERSSLSSSSSSSKRQKLSIEQDCAQTRCMVDTIMADEQVIAGPSNQSSLLHPVDPRSNQNIDQNDAKRNPIKARKRPARLAIGPNTPSKRNGEISPGSRSVPASPIVGERNEGEDTRQADIEGRNDLRDTLCGAPRRRPSVIFTNRTPALPMLNIPPRTKESSKESALPNSGPPAIWQDPSEHILSGKGSSLQHARSVYAAGPIEVLPGLFLGDEFNARDENALARLRITTILNVAKETTLPCQDSGDSRDLGFLRQSVNLSKGLERRLTLNDEAATPTSSRPPMMQDRISPPMSASNDIFFTPITSIPPALPSPMPSNLPSSTTSSRPSSLYLRNTSSTPNLNNFFQMDERGEEKVQSRLPGAYRSTNDSSDEDDEEDYETEEAGESAATSSLASHMSTTATEEIEQYSPQEERKQLSPSDLSVVTPCSSTFSKRSPALANVSMTSSSSSSASASSSAGSYTIALPNDAVALSVPPSPTSDRTWPIRYVKLPWTHDETDLAGLSSTGGFVTGCAIIADALGIDLRTGRMVPRTINSQQKGLANNTQDRRTGGVLVHCQCGVSRSATLVIAFVMQAAAYEYDFEKTRDLTGMHDCYEMVKGLSSSISPNISLIYQLVEWERLLSSQVAMQVDQNHTAIGNDVNISGNITSSERVMDLNNGRMPTTAPVGERRWGKEVMGEEDWMRMRAEEERKEQQEEAEREEKRMEEIKAREAQWRSAQGTKTQSTGILAKPRPKALQLGQTPTAKLTISQNNGSNGLSARRKKPSPSLTLISSSKTNADRALGLSGAKTAVTLLAPTTEDDEEDVKVHEVQQSETNTDLPLPELSVTSDIETNSRAKSSTVFPWLQGQKAAAAAAASSTTSSGPNSRPGSGYGSSSFGVMGQSAAERRIKHKRTFSAEVPDWNSRQSLIRSKTHDAGNRLSTLSTLAVSADGLDSQEESPNTANI